MKPIFIVLTTSTGILSVLNEQVLWPPLHSFLQSPFMVVLGKNFVASSICSMVFLGLFFVALTFCYQQLSTSWFGLGILLLFASTSPFLLAYGTMPMLEVFGAFFTAISAGLYLKNSKWFPLSLTLLFFLKYNYCVYVLMLFLLLEYGPRVFEKFRSKKFRILFGLSNFQIFIITYLIVLLSILITGGFKIGSLSVRGIGNPLYFLYLMILARTIITKQYIGIYNKIKRTGWESFIIPVALWLLIPIPNRVKTLVSFGISAPLSGHSPRHFSYYSYYFENLNVYFASVIILALCTGLAIVLVFTHWRDKRILFLIGLFVLPFLLMTVNQNKQERYLYTFIFSLWILAAVFIGNLSRFVLRSVCAITLCTLTIFSYDSTDTTKLIAWPFVPACLDEPLRFIASSVVDANRIITLGVSNDFRPALIMYHIQSEKLFNNRTQFGWKTQDLQPGSHLIVIDRPQEPPFHLPSQINLNFINAATFDNCLKITNYVVK